jgi:hypothetical protein
MTGIQKASHLAWRILGAQAYIVDTRTSVLHELDDVGTCIWKLIDTEPDTSSVARRITELYDVPLDQAQHDLDYFLKELTSKGLLISA